MAYKHDIFLSYKRHNETLDWIQDHFLPLLSLRVQQELKRTPRIYLDDELESGTSWPIQLGKELGRSRIMLSLWSGEYLHSRWCALEISHILTRMQQTGGLTTDNPRGLLMLVVIHDGNDKQFPRYLKAIQRFNISECFSPRMGKKSPLAAQLDSILANQAPSIAKAIRDAPKWSPSWPTEAATDMYQKLFRAKPPIQKRPPKFTDR